MAEICPPQVQSLAHGSCKIWMGHRKNIFVSKKIFVNPSVSKLLKWFLPSMIMGLKTGNPNQEQVGSRKAKKRKDAYMAKIN